MANDPPEDPHPDPRKEFSRDIDRQVLNLDKLNAFVQAHRDLPVPFRHEDGSYMVVVYNEPGAAGKYSRWRKVLADDGAVTETVVYGHTVTTRTFGSVRLELWVPTAALTERMVDA